MMRMSACIKILRLHLAGVVAVSAAFCFSTAQADVSAPVISLNYESLSSLEEPIAAEIGDVTLLMRGLLDVPYTVELDGESPYSGTGTLAQVEVSARTQLPNRWRVGLTWFAQYADDAPSVDEPQKDYGDRVALSVGSSWGIASVGNVSGAVLLQTRRFYGAGHARLQLDNALGQLDEWGAAYQVRLGPWLFGAAVDQDGNVDLGTTFQRPTGVRDYRITLRATDASYLAKNGELVDSQAAGAVGELIYGSTLVDFGLAVERLSTAGADADRWYVSSGVRHKTGLVTWSAEGHYGRIGGREEKSVALGLHYDVARGLSANLGINFAKTAATIGGANIIDIDSARLIGSIRYSF